MKKTDADKMTKEEIEKRDGVDDLIIEDDGVVGRDIGLASIGDGKLHFRACKNMEAREKLLEQINIRMTATNSTLIWKLKYALDKAEFARNHVLTEDLAKVEKFLRDAARLTRAAMADFDRDADAFRTLADVAKEIKTSEGDE
jgi:hypothetical protein